MKSKIFIILSYVVALILVLPNIFTFCSVTKYEEKPPSYSDTKISEWHKIRTTDFESVIKKLDSLLTKEAKNHYASLDEPYAAIVMQRSFANTISMDWNIEEGENDFYKKNYKSGFANLFSPNNFPYQQIKSKAVSICYYRHLQNREYDFKFVKDSLKKIYPIKKDIFYLYPDFTPYYLEEDSISNNYYFKTWLIGDEVRGGFYYEGTSQKKSIGGYYTGLIINKDNQSEKLELRITSIEVNNKKVLAFIDPKTKLEVYAVGKTIWKKPSDLTNPGRVEPFRY